MAPRVSVVIPTFNRRADVLATLESVLALDHPQDALEVLLIDNSSTDGTDEAVAELSARTGRAIVYRRKEPQGPVPARNLGARIATGEWLLFLDSDVSIAPDWLRVALAYLAARPDIAAIAGKVLYASQPHLLNCYGGALSRIGLCWDEMEGAPADEARSPAEVLWMNSSAQMVRRDAFLAVGGLDETFFYGYEEPDFGWRLTLAGWKSAVIPEAGVLHRVDAAPGRANPTIVFHYCKNRLRMMLKNAGPMLLLQMLAGYLLYSAADLVTRPDRSAKLRALWWNLTHLGETVRLRRQSQALRKVPDSVVAALLAPRWFPPRPLAGARRRAIDRNAASAPPRTQEMRDDRVA
ncbi:MAG: glycosyltransferase family 2 protein [Alphaproteobacteria bacterium]|nr:glycosyltransferase family 2 protein [Alphaproteobacteria bacterium]